MNKQIWIAAGVLLCVAACYSLISFDSWRSLFGRAARPQDGSVLSKTNEYDFDPENRGSPTFDTMQEEFGWQEYYDKFSPKEGTEAPDFELFDVKGEQSVRLSDFRGKKPVALVFGSFT